MAPVKKGSFALLFFAWRIKGFKLRVEVAWSRCPSLKRL